MTESERIDHNRLFKELISTFSDDFLAQFLSDLAARLRSQTLSFRGTELFTDTYLRLNAEEEAIFQAELAQVLPQNQEGIMEIVTSWMERGIERGIERGRNQEALALNLRLLSRRLGTVSPQQEETIRNLSLTQLEALSEALLDFTTSADLDTWLRQIGESF
ncbi:MAG: DUF4351 domain-containing protein [Spirulinaceae cyanobacterium]